MNETYLLNGINICKSYIQAQEKLQILKNINFTITLKQKIAIMGSSGSGKSTLLHILAGLDHMDSGKVLFKEQNLTSVENIDRIRNKYFGFIYQFHHLLAEFNVLENILMPLLIKGKIKTEDYQWGESLLLNLGLKNRFKHYPNQLSGGERQRVAIARAMINRPQIIFADEPTGNLDNNTAQTVLEALITLQSTYNTALVIVSHDLAIAKHMDFRYKLHDSCLEREE